MNKYIALVGDRLDVVVYKTYETLENFSAVLKENPHLHQKYILEAGDIVYLPEITKPKEKEMKALWN